MHTFVRLLARAAMLMVAAVSLPVRGRPPVTMRRPDATPVRDVRAAIAAQTVQHTVAHPVQTLLAPKHSRAELARLAEGAPVPGGVGYGYWFEQTELLWADSTVLDLFVVTPDTVGGNMNYFLYLTSTNRSELGVEAFISYYMQDEAQFTVFDWAREDHWQTAINLPTANPWYLTTRPDEYGHPRQMCRIRNATVYLGPGGSGYRWRNEAMLFNFMLGGWDLVYSYEYSTTTKEQNTYQPGDSMGSWAPIVEIWTDVGTYDGLNRIGFDLARLYQDGSPSPNWLLPANSFKAQMAFFNEITRPENRGFVVYTGDTDPDGDGCDNAGEAEAGTNPALASSIFEVSGVAQYPDTNEVGVTVESLLGRSYMLYGTPTFGGAWTPVGAPVQGTGGALELRGPRDPAKRYHRVRVEYDMGTLCVRTNTDQAGFVLSPAGGTIPSQWNQTPDGSRWDKCVVGIPSGTYLLSFSAVGGVTTPPDQWLTITKGGIAEAEGVYTPVMPRAQGAIRSAPSR